MPQKTASHFVFPEPMSRSGTIRTFVGFFYSPSGEQRHSSGRNVKEAALTGRNRWVPLCHLHGCAWLVVMMVVIIVVIWRKIVTVANFVFRQHAIRLALFNEL